MREPVGGAGAEVDADAVLNWDPTSGSSAGYERFRFGAGFRPVRPILYPIIW